MAKAKFVALTSFNLEHRIIAAGDTLFTLEAASAEDLHWFRARLGWSSFRVIVDEDAPVAPADDATDSTDVAPDAPADADKPIKGKRKG